MGDGNCSTPYDPIHDANVFGEAPSGRLESGRATNLLVSLALSKCFVATVIALAAWNVMEDHDSIAGLELTHSFAHRSNLARSFMTENSRRGMRSSGDLLQIGATNSAGVYPKQQFASAYFGHGYCFQANVVDSSIDGSQHRGGNGPLSFVDRELSGNRQRRDDRCREPRDPRAEERSRRSRGRIGSKRSAVETGAGHAAAV